jgi:integrase
MFTRKKEVGKRQIELIDEAKEILINQLDLTSTHPHFNVQELQIDRRTFIKRSLQFVFLNTKNEMTWSYFEKVQEFRNKFFKGFLALARIRYRVPNTVRHTYTSRLLTVGISTDSLAIQMGHTSTKMIEKYYRK